jgi:hypothetical protein
MSVWRSFHTIGNPHNHDIIILIVTDIPIVIRIAIIIPIVILFILLFYSYCYSYFYCYFYPTVILIHTVTGLYYPSAYPGCLFCWGLVPCAFRSWSSAPRAFYLCLAHQGLVSPFSALAGLQLWSVGLHWSPQVFAASGLPHFGALLSVALPPSPCFAVLDTPEPLPSQVRSSKPQEDLDWTRGASPHTGLGHFRGLHPLGTHLSNVPTPSPNRDFLTPRV